MPESARMFLNFLQALKDRSKLAGLARFTVFGIITKLDEVRSATFITQDNMLEV